MAMREQRVNPTSFGDTTAKQPEKHSAAESRCCLGMRGLYLPVKRACRGCLRACDLHSWRAFTHQRRCWYVPPLHRVLCENSVYLVGVAFTLGTCAAGYQRAHFARAHHLSCKRLIPLLHCRSPVRESACHCDYGRSQQQ